MKKILYLAAIVVLTSTWTGCSRGWPSCFCRDNDMGDGGMVETCDPQPACGCEGGATRHYGGSEYVVPSTPAVPSVPVPTAEPQLPSATPNVPSR